MKIKIVF